MLECVNVCWRTLIVVGGDANLGIFVSRESLESWEFDNVLTTKQSSPPVGAKGNCTNNTNDVSRGEHGEHGGCLTQIWEIFFEHETKFSTYHKYLVYS
jgi:hypothetical protein